MAPRSALVFALVSLAVACQSSSSEDDFHGCPTGARCATTGTSSSGDVAPEDAGTQDARVEDAGTDAAKASKGCPAKIGTVVFVGDSITAGAGQAPFYRTLLVANDDTKYPARRGLDFTACGIPAKSVVNVSKGGAVATVKDPNDPSDRGVLLNQVKALPASLPGPVLVLGTIGGNDGQLALANQAKGTATLAESLGRFDAGLDAALGDLLAPNRFGAAVTVRVLLTNVYDPSDGTGAFTYAPTNAKCPGALGLWPESTPTTSFFTQLNDRMRTRVAQHAGATLLDLHADFAGHGVGKVQGTNWFVSDCIHPNADGHDRVRALFWEALP